MITKRRLEDQINKNMSRPLHIGSSFEDFLKDENLHAAVTAHAIKRVLAWQIEQAMKGQGLTKVAMARRMKTSRAQLERLLDPNKAGPCEGPSCSARQTAAASPAIAFKWARAD